MDMEVQELQVNGMTCKGCEAIINRELGDIEGVHRVEADHESGVVTIATDHSSTGGYVEQVIVNLGYDVAAYRVE